MSTARKRSRATLLAILTVVASSTVLPIPIAGAQDAPLERTLKWLVLGDSYTSGEGIPNPDHEGCQRSKLAWPTVAFGAFGAPSTSGSVQSVLIKPGVRLQAPVIAACTGAKTSDVFVNHQPNNSERQQKIAQPTGEERYDLITFSFGGNDLDFASVIKGCLSGVCPKTEGQMKRQIAALAGTLDAFYKRIRDDLLAPDGKVIVVGYPYLLEESARWSKGWWEGSSCDGITRASTGVLRGAQGRLNQLLAERAHAAGFEFMDLVPIYESATDEKERHGLCAKGIEWLNGITAGYDGKKIRTERSFHPKALGHAATGAYLKKVIAGEAPPSPGDGEHRVVFAEPAPVLSVAGANEGACRATLKRVAGTYSVDFPCFLTQAVPEPKVTLKGDLDGEAGLEYIIHSQHITTNETYTVLSDRGDRLVVSGTIDVDAGVADEYVMGATCVKAEGKRVLLRHFLDGTSGRWTQKDTVANWVDGVLVDGEARQISVNDPLADRYGKIRCDDPDANWTPRQAETPAGISNTDPIEPGGVGVLRIGMTISEVEAALGPVVLGENYFPGEGYCGELTVPGNPDIGVGVTSETPDGREGTIFEISISNGSRPSDRGVHVGDSEQSVTSLNIPQLVRQPHSYELDGAYLEYDADGFGFRYTISKGVVDEMQTGAKASSLSVEGFCI